MTTTESAAAPIWHHIPVAETARMSEWMLSNLLAQALPGSPARLALVREVGNRQRRWSW